ncbi:MAG: PEP-CTERM sorting domain-containing protein [Myxococcota bacterium]
MTNLGTAPKLLSLARLVDYFRALLLVAAALLVSGSGHAATLVSVSGTGDLTIEADGAIYLDFSLTDLTFATLTAGSITLDSSSGSTYPASVPTTFEFSEVYAGLLGTQTLSFGASSGDILFSTLDWTGSLTLSASEIFGIGSLTASGTGPSGGDDCPPGSSPTGAIIISTTGDTSFCIPDDIVLGPNPIIIGPIGDISLISAIPEPTSALLFVAGFGLIVGRRSLARRRGHHAQRRDQQSGGHVHQDARRFSQRVSRGPIAPRALLW